MKKEYWEWGMGRPKFIAPLLAAILPSLISAAGSVAGGLIGSSATSSANEQNAANAAKANAVTNQQWGAEMKEKKREFGIGEMNQFNEWLKKDPALAKRISLIDTWGGGK
jgi:hypothetical protein